MNVLWTAQYDMVQMARAVLLDYCDTISPADFVAENAGFGRGGSMRNLLVHIGHTYQYWAGFHALGREMEYPSYEKVPDVPACRDFFRSIDQLMQAFISHYRDAGAVQLASRQGDKVTVTTPLQVFTHVITHEFHHKGQVLSISRQLGYTPLDTDIIR